MAVAVLPEAEARRDGDVGLLHQHLGEGDRPHRAEFLRERRPGEHGSVRERNIPPRLAEMLDQDVAPAAIGRADFLNAILRPVQRRCGRHLDRRKGAVIEIGFHPRQRVDEAGVAHRHADAPARHGVGFRQGIHLDGDVLRAFDLKDRGRRIAEIDLAVGKVRHDDQLMAFRQRHRLAVKIKGHGLRRRVGRIVEHRRARLHMGDLDGVVKPGEIGLRIVRRNRRDHPARDDEAVSVNGIGRIGREDHVPRRGDRLREVGEPFLGAEGRDDLRFRLQLDVEPALVIARHGAAQADDPARDRVTVRLRVARRLRQLVDDMGRGRHVRVAHAEIDDIAPLPAQ